MNDKNPRVPEMVWFKPYFTCKDPYPFCAAIRTSEKSGVVYDFSLETQEIVNRHRFSVYANEEIEMLEAHRIFPRFRLATTRYS